MARPDTYVDLTGRTFGRYRVLGRAGSGSQWRPRWRCLCDPEMGGCGAVKAIPGTSLKHNGVTRCRGCVGREHAARQAESGHTAALTQPVWRRVCKACKADFLGTARQKYCEPKCRPSSRPKT